MHSKQSGDKRVIVLKRGEEVISTLTKFCADNNIKSAVFTGIGAVERIKIGYYDLGKREYFFKDEPGEFEVASMNGNVALVDPEGQQAAYGAGGKAFIHVHAVLSRCDESCEIIAAHIKEAFVAVTLEVFMTELDIPLERALDESIGLKLIQP